MTITPESCLQSKKCQGETYGNLLNKIVFIGKNYDKEALSATLRACNAGATDFYVKQKGGVDMAKRGSYRTKLKSSIIQYMEMSRSRMVCATEIMQFLHEQGEAVNPTTVYRCLARLCDERMVIKYADKQGEKAMYQYVGETRSCTEHLHIQCIECGRIEHLDCTFMDEFGNHLRLHHGFQLQCEGSLLYGVCESCAHRTAPK